MQTNIAIQRIKKERLAAHLARTLKLSRSAVSSWVRVPAEHVIAVERELGIPRELIRPDLYPAYPPPPYSPAA
jgi:DNA-binding transcriptional regulator YdaS (Cro superfamily)